MPGKLFIVPTPVGNLGYMSPRAIQTLRESDIILAEDTRTSGILLKHFEISTPMLSHHKFNEHATVEPIVQRLLSGENISLISDAGTPGISDPGFLLSRECRKYDIPIETLPGPTAFVPALVNSGLPCEHFYFEGFLPQKKGKATRISFISQLDCTSIIYESPLRLLKTLELLAEACGIDRPASVSREISKMHDTTVRGTLGEIISYFSQNNPKGEIVIIIAGRNSVQTKTEHKNKFRSND